MGILRFFMKATGVALMLPAVAAIFFAPQLGEFVRGRLEARLSDVLQTPVTIGRLRVQPGLGRVEIYDLRAQNPAGFDPDEAFRVGRVSLEFTLDDLFAKPPRCERIQLSGAEWFLRHEAAHGVNLAVLAENARAAAAPGDADTAQLVVNAIDCAPSTVKLSSGLLDVGALPLELEGFRIDEGEHRAATAARVSASVLQGLLLEIVTLRGLARPLVDRVREQLGAAPA